MLGDVVRRHPRSSRGSLVRRCGWWRRAIFRASSSHIQRYVSGHRRSLGRLSTWRVCLGGVAWSLKGTVHDCVLDLRSYATATALSVHSACRLQQRPLPASSHPIRDGRSSEHKTTCRQVSTPVFEDRHTTMVLKAYKTKSLCQVKAARTCSSRLHRWPSKTLSGAIVGPLALIIIST